jgi:hypothetical protein
LINAKLVSFDETKTGASYLFENTNKESIVSSVAEFFNKEQYKLEEGVPDDGIYGTGSPAMRALFGGLVKRFKFKITILEESGNVRMTLDKAMSGALGGALGYSKMNKEHVRLVSGLKSLVAE